MAKKPKKSKKIKKDMSRDMPPSKNSKYGKKQGK